MTPAQVKQAVDAEDAQTVAALTEALRFKNRWNYVQVMDFFRDCGADPDDVEMLLYRADQEDTGDGGY